MQRDCICMRMPYCHNAAKVTRLHTDTMQAPRIQSKSTFTGD